MFIKKQKFNRILSLFIISTILIYSSAIFAQGSNQDEINTLIGLELTHFGSYGAPELKILPGADNGAAMWIGGRGGVLINRSFSFGGAGYGLIPTKTMELNCIQHPDLKEAKLGSGYGGLYVEYINSSNSLIHFAANFMFGIGGISYYHPDFEWEETDLRTNISHPSDFIFVLEPGVTANINIIKFFRIALGVGYRFVPGLDLSYRDLNGNKKEIISKNALNGVSVNLALKFGKF